ncbi:MAG: hypothetical protein ACRD3D_13935 [Terriglobia bacterium]
MKTAIRSLWFTIALLAAFGLLPSALSASQSGGSGGTSHACAGFAPDYCARTDRAIATDPAFPLPAVNIPFIDPAFGEREVRVTDFTLLKTTDPAHFSNPTSFFGGSASKYEEWGVFCPVSGGSGPTATCVDKGAYRLQVNIGDGGSATLFTFSPSTFTTALGIGMPGSAYTPVPYTGGQTPWDNGVDGSTFSTIDPDLMFGHTAQPFKTPSWVANAHFSLGVIVQPTTPNAHRYIVTTAGTTGSSDPTGTWCTTSGCNPPTDGTVTWQEDGAPVTAGTSAVVTGWHVTDPVVYLIADLSNCNAQASDFGSSDGFDGPYGTFGDAGFIVYGGHSIDYNGASVGGQDEWNYETFYKPSTNVCYWLNTQTMQIGEYNFNTLARTTKGQATDPITGAPFGLVQPPTAPTLTPQSGGSLPPGIVDVQVTYLEYYGGYFESTPSPASTATVSSSGSVLVTSPVANQTGMSGSVCNSTTTNCYYDYPLARYYDVYACEPTPCTPTRQTSTPVALGSNTTITSITSGSALPTVNRAGMPIHSAVIDQSGSLIVGTGEYTSNGGPGNFIWQIGTTNVIPWPPYLSSEQLPSGWQAWGGHGGTGYMAEVNNNGLNSSWNLWEHIFDGSHLSSYYTNSPQFLAPPGLCVPSYPWDSCLYAPDFHPTFAGNLGNPSYPMFMDAYRTNYPDGNNLMMATDGPWLREDVAVSPTCADATTYHCVYRFARTETSTFGGLPPAWHPSMAVAHWSFVQPISANGHEYVTSSTCTTGTAQPAWPTTPGATVSDGTCTWYEDNAAAPLWQSNAGFTANAFVQPNPPNGHLYKATTTGTTGSSQPTWCTTSGCNPPTDGTVTWQEDGTQNPNIAANGVNSSSNEMITAGWGFYGTSIHQISQDGKYVYGATDWDGSLAGTSCPLYSAGANLCGHVTGEHATSAVCDVSFMDVRMDTAGDVCLPEYDIVITELK